VARCAYRGERIREIEENWIDNNVKDEKERKRKKEMLSSILRALGDKADCKLEAVDGEFCIFHNPEYWRSHEDHVRSEFLKLLQSDGEKYFVGFHLPAIKLPKVINGDLHMELTKIHGEFEASLRFNGMASFIGATFDEYALFIGATFNRKAEFHGAIFNKAAFFINARINMAHFGEATFNKGAYFDTSVFDKAAFNEATFNERIWFRETIFNGKTWFEKVIFNGETWFYRAKFNGATYFDEAVFNKGAEFSRVTFRRDVFFTDLKFEGGSLIIFRSVLFRDPYLVYFDGTDMGRLLLLNTDIEGISLSNARLPRGLLRAHELLRRSNYTGFTFDDVIETYRRLRGNLERNHRFSDSGILFIGEMEARKERKYYEKLKEHRERKERIITEQQKLESKFHKLMEKGRWHVISLIERIVFQLEKVGLWLYVNFFSPYALYKHFSKYGESILRPIAWSIITIFVMPLLFTVLSIFPSAPPGNQPFDASAIFNRLINEYSSNLKLSILLFFQMASVDYKTPMSILILSILERILGLLFPALEILALKRMLERHP